MKSDWSKHKPKKFKFVGGWIRNWFSNFQPSTIVIGGIVYRSVENYYQAMKSIHEHDWYRMAELTPAEAKKAGRKLKIREDWEEVKVSFMKKALQEKIKQHPKFKDDLIATGNEVLVEWNNWGDKIWGADYRTGSGKNLLGVLLMEIREEVKAGKQSKLDLT